MDNGAKLYIMYIMKKTAGYAYLGRKQGSGWSWQRVPGAERTCSPGPATALDPDQAPPLRIDPRTQAPLESPNIIA